MLATEEAPKIRFLVPSRDPPPYPLVLRSLNCLWPTGKSYYFLSKKAESLFLQRKNPRKIAWTIYYRRKMKKGA